MADARWYIIGPTSWQKTGLPSVILNMAAYANAGAAKNNLKNGESVYKISIEPVYSATLVIKEVPPWQVT